MTRHRNSLHGNAANFPSLQLQSAPDCRNVHKQEIRKQHGLRCSSDHGRQTDRHVLCQHTDPSQAQSLQISLAPASSPQAHPHPYGCPVTRAYGWLFGITAMNSIRQKTALKLLFPLNLLFKGKKKANPLRQQENQTYSSEVLQNLRTQTASLYINTNHCTQNSFFFFFNVLLYLLNFYQSLQRKERSAKQTNQQNPPLT